MTRLKGMTWNHARGLDPMVACSADWEAKHGIGIDWDARPLQDFESYPVEDLARRYDLIVIDHPHVGQITAESCLAPLPDAPEIAAGSIGQSYSSYTYGGDQWAYPIDAAAQVQAIRPDLLAEPVSKWDDVVMLAQQGRVLLPLRAPHALMCFFTLTANDGHVCRNDGPGKLVDRSAGLRALARLRDVATYVDPECYDMDPIAVYERMAIEDYACAPLIYGYVNYAITDFRPNRLSMHDIPSVTDNGSVAGSALGGTGIAVSAFSDHTEAAITFARHVAGPEVQSGRFAQNGGQAGHRAAWTDLAVDARARGFYSQTLQTLDASSLRPRHNGYMAFQQPASERISQAMRDGDLEAAMDDLQVLFDQTFET